MNRIYLDYNATTPVRAEVLEAMLPYYSQDFGNPSSIHWAGRAVCGAVEKAREQVAALMGAAPAEIVFTSCGSEGNNFAIKGAARALWTKGRHLITSAAEHPSVLQSCRALEKEGWQLTCLPVDAEGQLDLNRLEDAISEQTVLISLMGGNNETGSLNPIAEIGELAQRHQVIFHSDLVQTAGRLPLDVHRSKLDLAVISGHKFGAPKGVGALFVRADTRLEPLIHGGHQERNRRAGTLNVAGIVGLGKACEIALQNLAPEQARIRSLRDRLEDGLFSRIDRMRLNGPADRACRLPNTLNVSFAGIEGESLLLNLDLKGIAASSGSACSAGTIEPSSVLLAMGIEPSLAQSSVRFSLGAATTEEEIAWVLAELPAIVERLRRISSHGG